MCLAGALVASSSLTQEVAGSSSFNMTLFLVIEFNENISDSSFNYRPQMKLGKVMFLHAFVCSQSWYCYTPLDQTPYLVPDTPSQKEHGSRQKVTSYPP